MLSRGVIWCRSFADALVSSVMYVYILSNKSRQLYVGVTNHLERRIYEHVTGSCNFTSRYRITRLVYFEKHETPIGAIRREKEIKIMVRRKKIALIGRDNPRWNDLADGWFDQAPLPGPGEPA
jgi:putative endonuclease